MATTFSPTDKAPGVYIQEITAVGPIAGAATSVAAFVGPARRGPINKPTFLTNWNQFVDTFGFGPPDKTGAYFPQAGVTFVTHAVAGFFANGGAQCWFVRVGTAARASLPLTDASAAHNETLVVEAKEEGPGGNNITVAVQAPGNAPASTVATRFETTINNAVNAGVSQVDVPAADAQQLRVGDWVLVDDGANQDRVEISDIQATTLSFGTALGNGYAAGTALRIADLEAGQQSIRVDSVDNLEPGSAITLTQGANTEDAMVGAVDGQGKHITLDRGLTNAYDLTAAANPVDIAPRTFDLVIGGTVYENLSMDARHSRYFKRAVDSPLVTLSLPDVPNSSQPPDDQPDVHAGNLAGGTADNPGAVTGNEFKAGIDRLQLVDANILCVPDRTDQDVQVHMIEHCQNKQDRFAILDPAPRANEADITAQRSLLSSDNGYAALYYPRIVIADPIGDGRITVPPSGHLAGLFARIDDARGVFKAPANETLESVLDLERALDAGAQGPLNEAGINVIRRMPGRGIRVWGARTIAPADAVVWRYVPVRRFTTFVEESIERGTQYVVFEPNTPALWESVKRQVREFLTRQWAAGALVGATADDAFQVICDESLNTPASMALGMLVVEVRMYPAPPAEFVVFRIIQRPGGAPEVQE
jgi:phage tail sheath protein FI